jgi:glycosyltransferase involved in cell wall biosynthesis
VINHINAIDNDVVVANWFGDYTDSIEELGSLHAPLVLRNGDMWWFQGSRHFAHAPGFSGSRWQRFLEKVFFPGEEQKTLERKKKHLYSNVSATVSPSPWMTQQAVNSGLMPKALHVTIPNPLDTSVWFAEAPDQARLKMGMAPRDLSVGFGAIGGMRDPRKGGDLLVQALEILLRDTSLTQNLRCDVFGQKAQSKQLGDLPFVSHGTLNDAELRSFYSAIDVFVVPSRMEGFPNTALEALACGTPVVAFDTGPMSDYLVHGKTALLAEAFSPEDLARQLKRALEDSHWREKAGILGREWVKEFLSPPVVAPQWEALFHRLLDSSPAK